MDKTLNRANKFKVCSLALTLIIILASLIPTLTASAATTTSASSLVSSEVSNYVMKKGDKATLSLFYNDKAASNLNFKYKVTNSDVISVSKKGVIKAKKNGSSIIKITFVANPNAKLSIPVYVGKSIRKLTLNKSSVNIRVGNYYMLKATVTPKTAAYTTLLFESSDESVATVSRKGKIKAISEGSAIITVSTLDGSNISKTCEVTVNKKTNSTSFNFPNPFFKNSITETSSIAAE